MFYSECRIQYLEDALNMKENAQTKAVNCNVCLERQKMQMGAQQCKVTYVTFQGISEEKWESAFFQVPHSSRDCDSSLESEDERILFVSLRAVKDDMFTGRRNSLPVPHIEHYQQNAQIPISWNSSKNNLA
ncbi:hypothetical protein GWI33_000551 [Rhynchophorus ferrugineus]|uniref:Uncharacterized protein n=1 Tax=Rhynchophorus ferrugineus TaxID=354439 RepID=A0A834MH87_RHYFE|nr:hypothetical protein GWI33_000551 [Rhynchophorus ferrugineus]